MSKAVNGAELRCAEKDIIALCAYTRRRHGDEKLDIKKGQRMNKFLRTILIGTLLAAGGAVVWAGAAPDPIIGTWTLNVAKSKFNPGPAPKSQTRTYAQSAQGIAMTFSGVAADGSAISGQSTFNYDGKDYPITGSPDYDTLSLKRVNGSTVKAVLKLSGKVVGSTTRSISAHGKVMTLSTKATSAKGTPYDFVAVFDKQ
jgi:hypothetical protein